MTRTLFVCLLGCLVTSLLAGCPQPPPACPEDMGMVDQATSDLTPPCDPEQGPFVLAHSTIGIRVYQRTDCQVRLQEWVTVVDLTLAKVTSLTGPVMGMESPPHPVLPGPNSRILKQSVTDFVNAARAIDPGVFMVVNGQFFDLTRPVTPVSFTIKQEGLIVSVGNNMLQEFPGQIRLVRIDNSRTWADIVPFKEASFEDDLRGYDIVVGGLDETADKGPTAMVPRTLLGTDSNRHVYFYSAAAATQARAAAALRILGARDVAMASGGNTTRLWVAGRELIPGSAPITPIPHVLTATPR